MIGMSERIGMGDRPEPFGRVQLRLVRLENANRQERGQAGHEDVDEEAGDDLVHPIADGEDGQQRGEQRRR